MEHMRAKCFELGLQRLEDTSKMNAIHTEGLTERLGDSLVKYFPRNQVKFWQKYRSSWHSLQPLTLRVKAGFHKQHCAALFLALR